MICCVKTVPSKLQWLSYCISLTVYTSSCVFTTDRAAGLELSSALTHTPDLLLILFSCTSCFEALPCRQLYTVSQTSAARFLSVWQGKGSGMEKALPRPLWPHGKGGEQSVRSPPATVGHICGRLSPRCSLRRSAAPTCLCTLFCFLAFVSLLSLTEIGHKNNQKRCTFSSLIMPPPPSLLPFPDYLYWWG